MSEIVSRDRAVAWLCARTGPAAPVLIDAVQHGHIEMTDSEPPRFRVTASGLLYLGHLLVIAGEPGE